MEQKTMRVAGAAIAALMAWASGPAHAQCENSGRSLAQMAAAKESSFAGVPSDVLIDREARPSRVGGWLRTMDYYLLPRDASKLGSNTQWNVLGQEVECRVQTQDGRWWLASRTSYFNHLVYTPEDDVRSRLKH